MALNSTTPILHHSYGYDLSSRLQTVTDKTSTTNYSATYTYVANSPLVSQIEFKQDATTRMTTTKQYDFLNRLTSIGSSSSSFSSSYSYNNANQRTRVDREDGSFWIYKYDSLGQVISGKMYWSDFTPVAGQQFEYGFDDIGNRTSTKAGGDENGANLRFAGYNANNLNQNTVHGVPGAFDVIGVGFATNEVTVNGDSTYRHGEYFRKEITVDNGLAPVWQPVTVASPGQASVTGNEFVPKYSEFLYYDLDGNLTNDGRWTYYWDAENRLVKMAANTSVGPQNSLQFEYDSKSRRIRKRVWDNTAWTGSSTNDLQFIYDGWNLIAELSNSHSALRTYTWGLDLSGSIQGAGGIGGLIGIKDTSGGTGFHFVAFDGNGNVSSLVEAISGAKSAVYEYGPFGEVIRSTGSMAKANPFRFSTKYQDDESDLLYYGYRYYTASEGRWLSRDLLSDEVFFTRLVDAHRNWTETDLDGIVRSALGPCYAFINNDPADSVDQNGLDQIKGGGQVTMGLRHHNQVVFYATCPKCTKFVLDGIDYQYVYADLVAHGVSSEALNNIPPGNPPSNLGGLAPGSPNGVNCDGKNVMIAVYMRSRLAWTGAAQMYADDTIINYHCAPCPGAK